MTELTILNLVLIVSVIIVLILILRKLYSQKPDEAEAAISKSIDEKFLQLENRIKDESVNDFIKYFKIKIKENGFENDKLKNKLRDN